MKPFTPAERQAIVDAHPAAAPTEIEANIDEYQTLVAEMMSRDPSVPSLASAPMSVNATASIGGSGADETVDLEYRLSALHAKLFPE